MVVMAAKFAGKCRRCGKLIRPGRPMDWTSDGGAMHVTPEECEQATETLELRGPRPEDPEERIIIVELLLGHPWKAATSARYKNLPHEYTLRKHWHNEDFDRAVQYIRRVGYEQHFIGRMWTYYDVGVHQYWTMGSPVPETTLINRAVRRSASARIGL